MNDLLAEIMTWIAMIVLLALFVYFSIRFIDNMLNEIFPPSPEEIAQREAKRIARQATKEFKQRQRMRAVRFWNF